VRVYPYNLRRTPGGGYISTCRLFQYRAAWSTPRSFERHGLPPFQSGMVLPPVHVSFQRNGLRLQDVARRSVQCSAELFLLFVIITSKEPSFQTSSGCSLTFCYLTGTAESVQKRNFLLNHRFCAALTTSLKSTRPGN
jgi:hypothetical protein